MTRLNSSVLRWPADAAGVCANDGTMPGWPMVTRWTPIAPALAATKCETALWMRMIDLPSRLLCGNCRTARDFGNRPLPRFIRARRPRRGPNSELDHSCERSILVVLMENAMSTQQLTPDRRPDVWAAGDAYEPYVGRWSRLVAREFLAWLALGPDLRWLDVGCGTGALTQTILAQAGPREVIGIDPSEGFIAYARDRTRDPRAAFKTADARGLAAADAGRFDAAVAGLVLNF